MTRAIIGLVLANPIAYPNTQHFGIWEVGSAKKEPEAATRSAAHYQRGC